MGQISNLTKQQNIILNEVKQHTLFQEQFYFTGGTALSSVYLHHRYSDDLDFFSEKKFDSQIIFTLMSEWSRKFNFEFQSSFIEVVYIFNLLFPDKSELKVDFSYYPYKRIEQEQIRDGIPVDSELDIAVNKLLTISQRTEVKDFVDLYFLLKSYSLWDLLHGVKAKFRVEIEPFILSADFLKVEGFEYLPKMIKPLTMEELKSFYISRAKELGKKAVE